jgi:IMP dehydrogenase
VKDVSIENAQDILEGASFDDVLINPLYPSTTKSRWSNEIQTGASINGLYAKMPIFSSPMDSLNSYKFFEEINICGGVGIVHRFSTIEKQKEMYTKIFPNLVDIRSTGTTAKNIVVSIGINGDWEERFKTLYNCGAKHFLIDVANGFNENIIPIVNHLMDAKCWIMAGNVATVEGYKFLSDLGVNAVRVGIGTGSACTTRKMTGIGHPLLSALSECKEAKTIKEEVYEIGNQNPTEEVIIQGCDAAIIADGGIKTPGDMVKCLMAGADAVMMGYVFSKTVESEEGLKLGSLKTYRGMASFSAMKDAGKNIKSAEGEEFSVKVEYTTKDIMNEYEGGLRSAMSYLGASKLDEMRTRGRFVKIHNNNREGYSDDNRK